MSESFLNGRVVLHGGDSREVLKTLADHSIDSIVCDPPYALVSIVKRFGKQGSAPAKGNEAFKRASAGFMGQAWDTGETAFSEEFWSECLRVLKPGGHVVAFSGTRTYHRMACAIEDAGFDVRNMLSWNFGSGFPKSHNISKTLDAKKERCSCPTDLRDLQRGLDSSHPLSGRPQQDVRPSLYGDPSREEECRAEGVGVDTVRDVRQADSSRAVEDTQDAEIILQQFLPEQDFCIETKAIRSEQLGQVMPSEGIDGSEERRLEGRGHLSEAPRQLRKRSLRSVPAGINVDGAGGWLRDGASLSDGAMGSPRVDADGMRPSSGSQTAEQRPDKSGIVAGQPKPQVSGAWDHCGRCGKPLVPDGLGSDLKPAHEPICLARKPLSENTIAANVLAHGTGAINIDGCRVEGDVPETTQGQSNNAGTIYGADQRSLREFKPHNSGRWPANILHDGSDEVIAAFPEVHGAGAAGYSKKREDYDATSIKATNGEMYRIGDAGGSAARFFASFPSTGGSCHFQKAANDVDHPLSLQSEAAASALSNAVAQSMPGAALNSASYRAPSMTVTANGLSRICEAVIALIQNIESDVWQGLPPKKLSLFLDPAEVVAFLKPTGIIRIMIILWQSNGFADRVTFDATVTKSELGGPASASFKRLHYTAKADANDRLGSKHPTVKPVDLMQWLCRLVTPKGGTILDPFAGTGTTGEAAFREGFNAVLIEREEEYQIDIRRRMALCMAGPDERKRESIKAKIGDLPFEPGSLFA